MTEIRHIHTPPAYSYPSKPGARNWAQIRHNKRTFYFGQHQSAQSYLMFGAWLQHLQDRGEAPETKDLKPLVNELINKLPQQRVVNRRVFALRAAYTCAIICLTVIVMTSAQMFLSDSASQADAFDLKPHERAILEGLRITQDKRSEKELTSGERTREIFFKLKEGHDDEPNQELVKIH